MKIDIDETTVAMLKDLQAITDKNVEELVKRAVTMYALIAVDLAEEPSPVRNVISLYKMREINDRNKD